MYADSLLCPCACHDCTWSCILLMDFFFVVIHDHEIHTMRLVCMYAVCVDQSGQTCATNVVYIHVYTIREVTKEW